MKFPIGMISALALAVASPVYGQIATEAPAGEARTQERVSLEQIENWPETAKEAAEAMHDKYGPPDEATATRWIWHENGPWKQTIVYAEEVDHRFPMPHKDVMEQFVDYDVPVEKFDELAAYDGSVIVERTAGVMSARCDKEAANFLAINLAHEVATDERTVEEARQFYADTIKGLMRGESSPYTEGFIFEVAAADTGDPDEALIDVAERPEK